MSSSSGLEIAASAASRAVFARGRARPHHRHAGLRHDRAHVGEIDVDQARPGDQLGDALHGTLQHGIRRLERIQQGRRAAEHLQELLVRNGDQRIDVLRELEHALIGDARALVAFHLERAGHHRDGEDAELLRDLRNHGRGAGAGAPAHAGGDEQHVAALDQLDDPIAILHCRLTAHLGVGARAQALGDVAADLQRGAHLGVLERLRVGVDADEIDALETGLHHVRDRVAAAAAHAQHLDDGALTVRVH